MRSRRAIIIMVAGVLIGIPAIALAASFIFARVTGQTSFSDSKAGLTIVSASGTVSNALNCEKTEGEGDRFTTNPIASRVTVDDQTSVVPGTSTRRRHHLPRGWKFSVVPGKPIPADSDGTLTLAITSTKNAEQGEISGDLSSDTDTGA